MLLHKKHTNRTVFNNSLNFFKKKKFLIEEDSTLKIGSVPNTARVKDVEKLLYGS